MDPIANEQMRQLAMRHPDVDVKLEDGRTVKASELPEIMAEDMAKVSKESSLIETAVGCFLRTL